MSFDVTEVKAAYIKLKSYIYYDNTDVILRKKLVEFESNTIKDDLLSYYFQSIPQPYNKIGDVFSTGKPITVDEKLELLTQSLNNYHEDSSFIDFFLNKLDVDVYPKTLREEPDEKNFITNKRVTDTYFLDRSTTFIDAPIE